MTAPLVGQMKSFSLGGFRAARVVLTVALLVLSVLAAVPALAADVEYVRAPWSSDIQQIGGDGSMRTLGYAEWVSLGAPTPRVASTAYVSVAWSSTVYAVLDWRGELDSDPDFVHPLTWNEYQRAGGPRVLTVAHVQTTDYYMWASNGTQIFARTPDGRDHRLTYAEWVAAGAPAATRRSGGFYRAAWSDVIHKVSADGVATRVSYNAWQAAGAPSAAVAPTRYLKTPWAPTVVAAVRWPGAPNDLAVPLSWADYVRAGSPAIDVVTRIPGDAFVKYTISDTVFHVVAGIVTPLTNAQWKSAGAPAPTVQTAPSPTYIRGILVVNKSLPLPSWFGSGLTPETTNAFERMRATAASSGLRLSIVSGFRSYSTQRAVYGGYVSREGVAGADRHSARPGFSEHQSGLTIDVNSVSASFASTPEGRWVAANAHRFGFIVRYPQGKESITGYIYEPWHLRYVGVDVATTLRNSGLTLEEYTGVSSVYR